MSGHIELHKRLEELKSWTLETRNSVSPYDPVRVGDIMTKIQALVLPHLQGEEDLISPDRGGEASRRMTIPSKSHISAIRLQAIRSAMVSVLEQSSKIYAVDGAREYKRSRCTPTNPPPRIIALLQFGHRRFLHRLAIEPGLESKFIDGSEARRWSRHGSIQHHSHAELELSHAYGDLSCPSDPDRLPIVFRLFSSPAEVLMEFGIELVRIGVRQESCLGSTESTPSASYKHRLMKYGKRGSTPNVESTKMNRGPMKGEGLAKPIHNGGGECRSRRLRTSLESKRKGVSHYQSIKIPSGHKWPIKRFEDDTRASKSVNAEPALEGLIQIINPQLAPSLQSRCSGD
ncbi:hypothetical protein BJ742DRAFT_872898 [Cladochytrium replicatum]|nr:hypothetical protein BJ742DRAFT_872898 [Cladochytrium replicatum]